jgi:hypothetical protein
MWRYIQLMWFEWKVNQCLRVLARLDRCPHGFTSEHICPTCQHFRAVRQTAKEED